MKSSNTSIAQAGTFRSSTMAVAALALATVISGIASAPAYADNDHRQGYRDNGRHRGEWQRRDAGEYRPVYRQPYYYAQPVYAPPPAYYPPPQSPGISLFFPLEFRR